MQDDFPPGEIRQLLEEAGYTPDDIRSIFRRIISDGTGKRPPGKRGRSTKWTNELHLQLLQEVRDLCGDESRKVSEACRILAEREPWKSLVETKGLKRKPADVLRERYVRLWVGAFELYADESDEIVDIRVRPKSKKRGGKHG